MSPPPSLLQCAIAHHQAGRHDEAEKAYRKLLRGEAANADALRLLGALYMQTKKWSLAVDCLGKAARLLPKDAETLTNLGVALRGQGRREDALLRYRQALDIVPDYGPALANLAALYQETGRGTEAEATYRQILRLNPTDATAHFNFANLLFSCGKPADSIAPYEQALKIKPDYLEAMINLGLALARTGRAAQSRQWLQTAQGYLEKTLIADPQNTAAMNNLANILRQQGKAEQAVVLYREALRLRPDYVSAAINLATSLRDLNRLDEAIASCRHALRLQPESADARINLGTFLQQQMRHEEAVALFSEALQRKPTSIDAQWNKSLSLLALGHYAEGWSLHEAGLGIAPMRGEFPLPERRWQGEDITGKRLLIRAEQGFGDTLQFVRYAALCKTRGATIIVQCPPALLRLIANCPFVDRMCEQAHEQDFDFHVAMMTLPHIFATTLDTIPATIPYLHIGAATRAKWANKFTQPGFKVGLVWAGNPREKQIDAQRADARRSMDLELLRPLFAIDGAHFYNLQMGAKAAQIDACGLRGRMEDYMGEAQDFEDTGAIIERLDLVITVDTSVAHLAGGLGKPVWILSRFDACWRWLQNRPDSPWYPTARIFGQQTPEDWPGVVERVKEALAQEIVRKR